MPAAPRGERLAGAKLPRRAIWMNPAALNGLVRLGIVLLISIAAGLSMIWLHQHFAAESARWESIVLDFLRAPVPLLGQFAQDRHSQVMAAVRHLPAYAQGLIPGVVIGDDSALPYATVTTMRMLSLSHLTAVSGAHVSLVLGVVISVCGRRNSLVTAVLCAIALLALVALVGPQASVLRAGMMGALMVVAIAIRRPTSALPLVCVAVLGACCYLPRLATSLGFTLSAVCTIAIVLFGYPLSARLRTFLPDWAAQMISLPLIAGLASTPFVAGIQDVGSMWAVAANIVVAPVVAPFTLCGLAAVLILPIWPSLAQLGLLVCRVCAWWMYAVAEFFGRLPGSGVPVWRAFTVNALVLVMLVGGARWVTRHRSPAGKAASRRNVWLGLLLCTAAVIVGLAGWLRGPVFGLAAPQDWEIVQCDVGQGAALLVRSAERTALLDVGPEQGHIARCLKAAGVRQIDLLVLSHFDADHVRGLGELAGKLPITQAWVSVNDYPRYNSRWALALLARYHVPVQVVTAGAHDGDWLQVLSPAVPRGGERDTNRDSLVVRAVTAHYSVLALADVPAEVQEALVWERHAQADDIVVVAHHGAASQSPALAQIEQPRVSLISVGRNDYGHPTEQAQQIWRAPIGLTTQRCGLIAVNASGVYTQKKCALRFPGLSDLAGARASGHG